MGTIADYQYIAVKIGSSLLVDQETGLVKKDWLSGFAKDVDDLIKQGRKIIIISSGAIALGKARLGLTGKPLNLDQKQACAAVGQALLIGAYDQVFTPYGLVTAQALMTLNDTEDRRVWLDVQATLSALSDMGAITIINENDTVATDEIRYGDNDRLAARVAQMVGADLLVLLSDVDGLYDKNPSVHNDAQHIKIVTEITPEIIDMGAGPNQGRGTGSGGMATKLLAAQIATQAGCAVVITEGVRQNPLMTLTDKGAMATWFTVAPSGRNARKQWIAGSLKPQGTLVIDDGAISALKNGKSLLSAGVTAVTGAFDKGATVLITDMDGVEIGRGLIGYRADDARRIKGLRSGAIEDILGYDGGAALIHRDDMVLSL